MHETTGTVGRLHHFLHARFLKLIIGVYLLAALAPALGQSMRDVSFGRVRWLDGSPVLLTLPLLMLSVMLFNAGLNLKTGEMKSIGRYLPLLLIGIGANLLLPAAFAGGVAVLGRWGWKEPYEVESLLAGLALIAAMPIAAASTAWSQKGAGNLAVSLGLVTLSTLFSPLLTPATLHLVGNFASGDMAVGLHRMAQQGTSGVLTMSVLLPSLLGIGVRSLAGEIRVQRAVPGLRLLSLAILLLLNYSNGAVVLPEVLRQPDGDFLFITLLIIALLCATLFLTGWFLPRLCRAGRAEQTSMMFGLGMNNNGAGMVLTTLLLEDHPTVLVPILLYNLVQQVMAGVVDARVGLAAQR